MSAISYSRMIIRSIISRLSRLGFYNARLRDDLATTCLQRLDEQRTRSTYTVGSMMLGARSYAVHE